MWLFNDKFDRALALFSVMPREGGASSNRRSSTP
jgi:hypothetical protein